MELPWHAKHDSYTDAVFFGWLNSTLSPGVVTGEEDNLIPGMT